MTKLTDKYLIAPIFFDVLIGILLSLILYFKPVLQLSKEVIASLNDIHASLIDTSISLAGFILAALTIIVTFKANISYKSKPLEEAATGMELLFSSKLYLKIVNVFKWAIIELVFNAILLYLFGIFSANFISFIYLAVALIGLMAVFGSIFRCMYVMFAVINIEASSREQEEEEEEISAER